MSSQPTTSIPSTSSQTSLSSKSRTTTPRATPPNSSSSRFGPESDSPQTPSTIRRLPTASPPSARLRRLAPTPVKIPPTPPLPPSLRGGLSTYKHWTAGAVTAAAGGSPVKKSADVGRKGSVTALALPLYGSGAGLGEWIRSEEDMGNDGQLEEDEGDDPFDLDIQFASPLPSSSLGHTGLQTLTSSSHHAPLGIPPRATPHRQSSSATDRTASTQPSFSTSPVYHSHPKILPSSNLHHTRPNPNAPITTSDRSSLPAPGGRNRTRSSRTIPDVPDEILDTDDLSSDPSRSERSNRQSALWSGSDDDARAPTRRTGDELLSPGAFLAAHVPRPVLVQFRDVFGGNDTMSPHLPASIWASPVSSPVTVMATSPGTRMGGGSWGRSQGPEVGLGLGLGDSPTRPRTIIPNPSPRSPPPPPTTAIGNRHDASPGGISIAESFATFGVHRTSADEGVQSERERRTREESGNSDVGSFTFSAYLADDDPVREEVGGWRDEDGGSSESSGGGIRLSNAFSSRPIPRSNVPLHQPKAPEFRTHTHLRNTPTPTPTSARFPTFPLSSKRTTADQSKRLTSSASSSDTPDLISTQRTSHGSRPSASPSSSDDGEVELVTPEQRDQALHGVLGFSAQSRTDDGGGLGKEADDFGTPTPMNRNRDGLGVNIGLGLTLSDETTYTQPGSSTDMADFFIRGVPKSVDPPSHPSQKLPKMMRDDYQLALESKAVFGLSADSTGHPVPFPRQSTSSQEAIPEKVPKKFKSLASLRRRLPSSRGAPLPPPAIPLLPDSRGPLDVATVEYASLTGKPAPSRPGTAVRHPPTSQTGPSPIGDSLLDWRSGTDTPPLTGTSIAFSVNSTGTATTVSSVGGRVTSTQVPGIKKVVMEENDGWKGGLKSDLCLDGVVVPVGMTLNLWVDQENCREVISTLHAIRWHPPFKTRTRALDRIDGILCEKTTFDDLDEVMDDSHDEGNVFWEEGCVEFGMNPRKRAKWEFSYGALEAFPSLRRVTMDGKQNYDFTSRIASLRHRVRGIYAVCGEEKNGARWRFRYMVDIPNTLDPRARIIVPMSFYVNPAFLQGTHASKLGFSNMLGKALRPNIHSEKMSTPELSNSATTLVTPQPVPTIISAAPVRPPRPSVTEATKFATDLAVSVRVETATERDRTPRQAPARQYRPGTADARMVGGGASEMADGGRMGETSPLLPKAKARPFGSSSAQASAIRSPRPSTAQEPRQHIPLSSLANTSNRSFVTGAEVRGCPDHLAQHRARPGTASAALPSPAQLDKSVVAPFLTAQPPTPSTQLPPPTSSSSSSRIAATFRRSRALTSGARPTTPLSAPLPPVPEMDPVIPAAPASATRSTFANGMLRAKKSLSNLRPPSRPGTAGLPISRPLEPPLPTSSSAGLLGLGLDVAGSGRLRTKSSNAAGTANIRPNTAGGAPTTAFGRSKGGNGDGSQSAGIFSSFAPFSTRSNIRPSTANPSSQSTAYNNTSAGPTTPLRPPTAPNIRPLQFGFGSYVDTPPHGVTYSNLALQQIELKKTPGTIRREFYGADGNQMEMGQGINGSGGPEGRLRAGTSVEARRPRTATGDGGRGKVSGTMI